MGLPQVACAVAARRGWGTERQPPAPQGSREPSPAKTTNATATRQPNRPRTPDNGQPNNARHQNTEERTQRTRRRPHESTRTRTRPRPPPPPSRPQPPQEPSTGRTRSKREEANGTRNGPRNTKNNHNEHPQNESQPTTRPPRGHCRQCGGAPPCQGPVGSAASLDKGGGLPAYNGKTRARRCHRENNFCTNLFWGGAGGCPFPPAPKPQNSWSTT